MAAEESPRAGQDPTAPRAPGARPGAADLGLRMPIPYRAVYEFFPGGVVIADARGLIQGANLTAKRLLGTALERDRVRCCDLFDCRRMGTPLADHCITELALERPGPLPEVRVDLPVPAGSVRSVWVNAAAIAGSDPIVTLLLRPGVVGDRRRRTEPHWMAGPQLRIFTLGRTRLESGEGPIAGEWLGHRPGQLLKYLICNRDRVVPADELIEVFWPHTGPRGATSVRQAVHTMRDRLEPTRERHGASSFVAARPGGYELQRETVWIDADDFEQSVRAGLAALSRGETDTAEPGLSRAVALYRGDFLSEEAYAEWAFAERDRLRDLAGQALRGLSQIRMGEGDLEGATEHLHRLAELEPLELDVQRDLLALLLRRGRHAEAHRRHEIVRRRYRRTFGEDLPFALADLSSG